MAACAAGAVTVGCMPAAVRVSITAPRGDHACPSCPTAVHAGTCFRAEQSVPNSDLAHSLVGHQEHGWSSHSTSLRLLGIMEDQESHAHDPVNAVLASTASACPRTGRLTFSSPRASRSQNPHSITCTLTLCALQGSTASATPNDPALVFELSTGIMKLGPPAQSRSRCVRCRGALLQHAQRPGAHLRAQHGHHEAGA